MIQQVAQKLIDNGIYIVPLLPNEKMNDHKDILTRDYKVSDLIPNGNLGVQLEKSGWYCIDLDSDLAIHFGCLWLPRKTRIHGRINQGKKELTHFFFESDNSIKENESLKFIAQTVLQTMPLLDKITEINKLTKQKVIDDCITVN